MSDSHLTMIEATRISEELPYNKAMERLGAVYNNNSVIIDRNWIVDRYTTEQSTVHNCVSHGDCKRCSQNDKMTYEYIVLSPIRSKMKFTFIRWISDKIGSCWSDWYEETPTN